APQTKETPTQPLEHAGVAHRVEGLPVDAKAQSIRHADHAAAGADSIPLVGEHLPRTTRHGDIVAPLIHKWMLFVPSYPQQTQGWRRRQQLDLVRADETPTALVCPAVICLQGCSVECEEMVIV